MKMEFFMLMAKFLIDCSAHLAAGVILIFVKRFFKLR
jgi:hypothetical protein